MAQFYPISGETPPDRFPFGADFFKRKFPSYIRQYCTLEEKTTVLELILADGLTMDVSHIEEIDNHFVLVAAFTDERHCGDTFRSYVRYETILRVNVKNVETEARAIGFSIDHEIRDLREESET